MGDTPIELVRLDQLRVEFPLAGARRLTALEGLDLSITPSESHGLVGESGSGKTVAALAMVGLLDPAAVASGGVWWEGRRLDPARPSDWRGLRGRGVTMMFQDARASLNPARRVGAQLRAVLCLHGGATTDSELMDEAEALLTLVRLGDWRRVLNAYPHELSGGMAQRVALALALACRPRLLIADEPTAALDATVAVATVALLRSIQRETGLAMLVISHDMNVVAALCDRLSVLAEGRLLESGPTTSVLREPRHPHTAALLAASRWELPSPG